MTPEPHDTDYGPRPARVTVAAYVYCGLTGLGIGAFCAAPELGTAIGLGAGAVAGGMGRPAARAGVAAGDDGAGRRAPRPQAV